MGRPVGYNFEKIKYLRMNEEQEKNWNRNTPKLIRDLLDGKMVSIELLKQLYNFMSNEKKCVLKEVDDSDLDLINRIKEVIK